MTREDGRDGSRAGPTVTMGSREDRSHLRRGSQGGTRRDFIPVVTESFLPLARGPP